MVAQFGWVGGIISISLIPVAIGIAILRYHLYEIDRVISRTLGWTIVTALLAGVLVGGIAVLEAVLAPFTNENTIAVAASTLVAAALFQPLRRRVQRAVDRRFDRAHVRRAAHGGRVRRAPPIGRGPRLAAFLARGDRGRRRSAGERRRSG